jgi:hydroxyethylthiazole kinase-like uncharacterized protein yjeF
MEWTLADTARIVRMPTAHDDKYTRGVVGMRTGSEAYPGAAVLGVEAASRAGAGMVRYVGPERAQNLVLQQRPETVAGVGRVQAWVIGSGTSADARSDEETEALRGILEGPEPVVVDAGALDLVHRGGGPWILTPHDGEHARLRARLGLGEVESSDEAQRAAAALETATALSAVVVLKGAVTEIAEPGGWTTRVDIAPPWLATAGAGDVLAGTIGAVVAGGPRSQDMASLARHAAAGVWLHSQAATMCAAQMPPRGGPMTALDVASCLPRAVALVVGSAPRSE